LAYETIEIIGMLIAGLIGAAFVVALLALLRRLFQEAMKGRLFSCEHHWRVYGSDTLEYARGEKHFKFHYCTKCGAKGEHEDEDTPGGLRATTRCKICKVEYLGPSDYSGY
jgi:hypothetical protein